jgi:hypothetical protein
LRSSQNGTSGSVGSSLGSAETEAETEGDGEGEVDSLVLALGEALLDDGTSDGRPVSEGAGSEGVADAVSLGLCEGVSVTAVSLVAGEGDSSANAEGADSRASGAMTAVAAAAAMARRSFIKTSRPQDIQYGARAWPLVLNV